MTKTLNIRAVLARLFRMVLVFMLVFWSSLRVEYLVAFAEESEGNFGHVEAEKASDHDGKKLTDLVIYQKVADKDAWKPVPNAQAKGSDKASVSIKKDDGEQLFVAVPVWGDEYPDGYEDEKKISKIKSAKFVEWKVDAVEGEDANCVSTKPSGDDDEVKEKKSKNIFTVNPKDNGTATVVVEVSDEAAEDVADLKASFKVDVSGFPIDIAKAEVEAIEDQTYDKDKPAEPKLTVSYEGKELVADTDYSVSYADNEKVGKATVTITGKGDYFGTQTIEFNIVEAGSSGSPGSSGSSELPDPSDSSGSPSSSDSSESPSAKLPEVESVQLTYSTDGDVLRLGEGGELVPASDEFSFEGGDTIEFQFGADVVMDDGEQKYTLEVAKEKFASSGLTYKWQVDRQDALADADSAAPAEDEGAQADPEGAKAQSEGASITQAGLLTVSAKGKYKVTCVVSTGDYEQKEENGEQDPDQTGGDQTGGDQKGQDGEDPAGAQDGQDQQDSQNPESTGGQTKEEGASDQPGADGKAEAPEGEPGVSTQAAGEELEEKSGSGQTAAGQIQKKSVSDQVIVDVGGVDDPQGPAHPQDALEVVADMSSLALGADGQPGPAIDRTYTVDELKAGYDESVLSADHLYSMTASGESAAITGRGVPLAMLLEGAFAEKGIDLSAAPVESVTFENYKGTQKKISWDFLKNEKVAPLLALDSYVHQEGDDADQPADASKLVDNARFRLLFGYSSSLPSADSDADDYRWIKKVQVNFPTKDSEDLSVSIEYTPVPLGQYAELVAKPVHTINGKWDCRWEVSTKSQQTTDGKPLVWTELEDETNQTLKVLTSEDAVGNWYRVTIDNNTNTVGGEKSKELVKTSDPVRLVAAKDEPRLVLSYNPPRAGDMAIFTSSVYNYDGDVARLEYVWEWSDDGGSTWNELKGEKKSTLKIQTEPVSSEGSASDGASPTLIYIRVRAIPPTGDPLVSNAQPLTVHVGDDDSDVGGDDPEGKTTVEEQPKGGETKKKVTEVPLSIDYSDPSDPPKPTSSPQPEALDPSGVATAPQVYINEAVSEKVAEQQEAIQEYVESTTPGARWTQLNTLEPSGDDVSRVLEGNPFAPLVVPFGLGVTAAGGVEKLIVFRREVGKPFALIKSLRSK